MFPKCCQAFAVIYFYVTSCANRSTVLQSTVSQGCFVLCEVRSVVILFISELWLKKNPVRRMPMPWKQEDVSFKDASVFLHILQAGAEHIPEQVMQYLRTGTPRGDTKRFL